MGLCDMERANHGFRRGEPKVSLKSSFGLSPMRGSQQRNRARRIYHYQYFVGAQSALRGQLESSSTTSARHAVGGLPLPCPTSPHSMTP
jgi:hypothetical protein